MMDTVFMCLYDTINYLTIPGWIMDAVGTSRMLDPMQQRC